MTEKEMIEEMANIIDKRLIEANNVLGSMNKGKGYWLAQKLVEYYQPKLPEGSVVLDRYEAQKYFAYKHIEPQIKGCLDRERELEKQVAEFEETCKKCHWITDYNISKMHEKEVIALCEQEVKQARKEAAKEILLRYHAKFTPKEVDEFIVQYGVEE